MVTGDREISTVYVFQDSSLVMTENLNNPNKSRVKGPSGRKLPTRKRTEDEENIKSDSSPLQESFKSKLSRCLVQKKLPEKPEQPEPADIDINQLGKINNAEFNKVWFLRVPSLSSLVDLNKKPPPESVTPTAESDNNNDVKVEDYMEEEEQCDNTSNNTNSEAQGSNKLKKSKIWKNCQIL